MNLKADQSFVLADQRYDLKDHLVDEYGKDFMLVMFMVRLIDEKNNLKNEFLYLFKSKSTSKFFEFP